MRVSAALVAGVAGVAAGLAASHAPAQLRAGNDPEICAEGTGIADLDVMVCERAIRRGGHAPATLATLHSARGVALRNLGRRAEALAAHDAALAANPVSASAWHGRGLVRLDAGEHAAAIADLGRAVALFPGFAHAWRDRGRAHFLAGDRVAARADLDRALELLPGDLEARAFRAFVHYQDGRYAAAALDMARCRELGFVYRYVDVWLHLARARAGESRAGALDAALAWLDAAEWPRPVIEALLGVRTPAAALEAARASHPALRARRTMETEFYLGAGALLRADEVAARRHFGAVLESPFRDSVEHVMARHELAALEQGRELAPPTTGKGDKP